MSELSLPVRRSPRRAVRMLITVLLLGSAIGAASWWYLEYGRWYESTENAYVQGNVVTVSAKVAGEVIYLAADQNDHVEAGQQIVRLATGDAQRAVKEAKHMLGMAVREIMTRRARVETARSELELKRTSQRLAQQEYERRLQLVSRKMVSQEELDAARTRADETAVELQTARNELIEAEVQAGTGDIREHPMLQVASARFHDAWRQLGKHAAYSKVAGRVARRMVQIGQVVPAGAPLYTVVEANNLWVEANFKETQLGRLRPGQPVEIVSDTYGEERIFAGRVNRFGTGTGATFSLLPPQNATGNWIKIVQRVPVRIDFAEPLDDAFPLMIGSSLDVRVDTHDQNSTRSVITENRGQISRDAAFEDIDAGVEEVITRIIDEAIASVES